MSGASSRPTIETWTGTWEELKVRAIALLDGFLTGPEGARPGAWVLHTVVDPLKSPRLFWTDTRHELLEALVPGAWGHLFTEAWELRWRRLGLGSFRLTWLSEKPLPPGLPAGGTEIGEGWDWVDPASSDQRGDTGFFLYGAFLPHLNQFVEVGAPGALGGRDELGKRLSGMKAPVQGASRRLSFRLYRQNGMVRQVRLTGLEICVPLTVG